jgi:tetratricopeptide (TPR) repeat protein
MTRFFKMVMIFITVAGVSFFGYADDIMDTMDALDEEMEKIDDCIDNGYAKYDLKDYKSAIVNYSKAIELFPQNIAKTFIAPVYYYRGNAKLKLNDYKGAIADYSKAIELDPQNTATISYRSGVKTILNASVYSSRGDAEFNLKDYHSVIADYTNAIELDPKNASYYFQRGQAYFGLSNYNEAIRNYTMVLDIDSKDVDAYNCRGWNYLCLNEWQKAEADFLKVVELAEKSPLGYGNLAICYWKTEKNKNKALEYYEKCFQNGFDHWDALYDNTINGDGHFISDLNQTPQFKALIEKYRKKSDK